MLDDLMDEYGVDEPKKKTVKPKNSKTVKPKKDKPPKRTSKATKPPKSKGKPKAKSSKKQRIAEDVDKLPAQVHGNSETIPVIVHEYLIKKYYNVHYELGTEENYHTRQFRMRDTEDELEDYTVKMNIEGGGRDVIVRYIKSNVDTE